MILRFVSHSHFTEQRILHFAGNGLEGSLGANKGPSEQPKMEVKAEAGLSNTVRREQRANQKLQRQKQENSERTEEQIEETMDKKLQNLDTPTGVEEVDTSGGSAKDVKNSSETIAFKFKVEFKGCTPAEIAKLGIKFEDDTIAFDNRALIQSLKDQGKSYPRSYFEESLQLNDLTDRVIFERVGRSIVLRIVDKPSDGLRTGGVRLVTEYDINDRGFITREEDFESDRTY